jgi:hypothetical protein
MKFITTSTDPSSYGAGFDPTKLDALNSRIAAAAERAGIDVIHGDPYRTQQLANERDENGDSKIDWFAHWCSVGFRYSTKQWSNWFRKQ